MTLILGIDPGLTCTGWGVIRQDGNRLSLVACGTIKSALPPATGGEGRVSGPPPHPTSPASGGGDLTSRLHHLSTSLARVIETYRPHEAAVEETFVNVSGQSTLKLGQARGALLLTLAQAGLPVAEYAARLVKKSVTGSGAADKAQVAQMVQILLPGCGKHGADAMDTLAVAISNAHHRGICH